MFGKRKHIFRVGNKHALVLMSESFEALEAVQKTIFQRSKP